jgi:hypothetical protein
MWSIPLLAIVAFVASDMVVAIPVLPLSVGGVEKLEALKRGEESGLKTFIVQVKEKESQEQQQKEELKPEQQEQRREFPWPYPPVFESVLPIEAKQRLTQIYVDSTLNAVQRERQVNAVFDELPQQIIERLPLPAEYERLPADVYKRIVYIHVAPGFKWAERQNLIRDIVESLPAEQKQLMQTPRIGGPPPGFEFVLAPTVYKQLLLVHHNPRLAKEEKSTLITQIMRQVPQEQLDRLPLPADLENLPAELKTRARSLVFDYSIPQQIRAQRVHAFIQQLAGQQLR